MARCFWWARTQRTEVRAP